MCGNMLEDFVAFMKARPEGLGAAALYDAISLHPDKIIGVRTFLGEHMMYFPKEPTDKRTYWVGVDIPDIVMGKYA